METITINGVDFEIPKAAAQAVRVDQAATQARLDSAKAELSTSKSSKSSIEAERDSLKSDLDKSKAAHVDAEDPAKLSKLVQERVALVSVAAPILKLDADEVLKLDEAEIKRQVIVAINPTLSDKIAKADSAYLEAAYDCAIASHDSAPSEGLSEIQPGANAPAKVRLDSNTDLETLRRHSEKVRLDTEESQRNFWQKPLMTPEGTIIDHYAQA